MTYARSYATSRKPKKAIKFRRSSNKRKIDQASFPPEYLSEQSSVLAES